MNILFIIRYEISLFEDFELFFLEMKYQQTVFIIKNVYFLTNVRTRDDLETV